MPGTKRVASAPTKFIAARGAAHFFLFGRRFDTKAAEGSLPAFASCKVWVPFRGQRSNCLPEFMDFRHVYSFFVFSFLFFLGGGGGLDHFQWHARSCLVEFVGPRERAKLIASLLKNIFVRLRPSAKS